ncbi:MAG: histidine phosphatase family protein [Burkholderiaceae bacterium]
MKSAATLYLIRHGRTDGNGHHYVGREDLELNATGHAQAASLAQALANVHLDAIYCSVLRRARQTAAAILGQRVAGDGTALQLQARRELMEIDYGDLQGRLKRQHPLHLRSAYAYQRMPGGESLADVYVRVAAIAEEFLARLRQGESFAVVGHYRSNQMLCSHLFAQPLAAAVAEPSYQAANGALLCLRFADPACADRLELVPFALGQARAAVSVPSTA